MVRLSHLASYLTLAAATASAAVVDLVPKNFDEIVLQSGKPALVEFFAPWCGHCKNLAPTYEELSQAFAHATDKVTVAKVDADEHRDLGRKFGVQGFPTLKWFDGKSDTPEDYKGGRDLESLSAFITEKTGVKPRGGAAKEPSAVEMLTDETFGKVVGGEKDVLVAFTAPWCGHCKNLAPTWETLANDFAREANVVIAKVDAEGENSKATAKANGVTGYPTIKFFPRGSTEATVYNGARSEQAFVDFLNEHAGTHRAVGGGLNAQAGTIAALNELIVAGGPTSATLKEEIKKAAEGLTDQYAPYYVKVADKLSQNAEYVTKELARLEKILAKGGSAPEKLDDLVSRSNILRQFVLEEAHEEKDEL
ncbi:protein disulfide isomerase family protein [Aspergillus aculeatinus CBS 121060]|uniref:protein disulfide-isomerase n=3 Tax=Aspergillus TaxID=5052 RepID=A0A8G1RV51_9EURO|nr:protein disulfide-isomerase [Aspergillus brunneoviolaceus CBS 621.78]XP_025503398.1 protein disulfide-isomerase [Aspergillus aculeatinus CBS 121060]XP_040803819.1 protein disulfide-isomerase [Aspergillus fijiensis CBS 313.89]RAH45788.1 protein disulfide-isomerase [Aspergillus brunneoviolaceus CBS 621.78]RAH69575.1 protein disulfide-isomerase [Aspergillus aculeatinus CBS 121060]RAK79809.1 protein disulfide-isomerase [Aspergillus fijiensis CBS 313.89]